MAQFSGNVFNRIVTTGDDAIEQLDTTWDDLRAPATVVRIPTAPGTFPVFNETYIGYEFSATQINYIFVIFQLPHSYKLSTDLYPHIHWLPNNTDTGTVRWQLEYSVNVNGSVQPSFTTSVMTPAASGVAYKQQINSFPVIDGSGINALSAIVSLKLSRIGNDAVNDTYNDVAIFKELDLHYEIDTLGSRSQFVK